MRTYTALLLISIACVPNLAQSKNTVRIPRTQTIGEGVVWRISDNKGGHDDSRSPWKEVQVTNVFGFKKRPTVGERVTVVPLDVNIAPINLRIIGTKRGATCGELDSSVWWEVELEPVKQKDFFEISSVPKRREEVPFDVGVIYPAVKFARQVKGNKLTKEMLPNGVAINTVKGAIDLTNDGIPDVLLVEYCCGSPKKVAEECNYTCGKTFKKVRGTWKLVDTSAPC
jgi:hypothetical protein